jgi:hypothetical protein
MGNRSNPFNWRGFLLIFLKPEMDIVVHPLPYFRLRAVVQISYILNCQSFKTYHESELIADSIQVVGINLTNDKVTETDVGKAKNNISAHLA